jgi:RNA polymerase sigma-70 factor (ECF subfamily)
MPFFDEEPSGENQIQKLTHRALVQVRNEFEDRTWQAFWRCVVDGISTDQVADELGLSSASVR